MKFLYESSTRYLTSARSERVIYRVENTKRHPYLCAPLNYFVYYLNIVLKRSRLNSRYKQRKHY